MAGRGVCSCGQAGQGTQPLLQSPFERRALIEQWKYGNLWRGKDYRVIRACMPPNATIAASAAGTRRTGNVCYK